jgi:hypothetical protein
MTVDPSGRGGDTNADARRYPLYSNNRLKLRVFGANVSNGCAATTAPGHLEMTWANSSDIVTTADRAGFRGVGAGSALEGLRRHHQFQRHLLRNPGVGGGNGSADTACSSVLHDAGRIATQPLRRRQV